VRTKKNPKKKKTPPPPTYSPEEISLLNQLLSDVKGMDISRVGELIPSPRLARAFLENIPLESAESVDLVLAVMEAFDHRDVSKSAKKALYKLKQKGFAAADHGSGEEASFRVLRTGDGEPEAYIGLFDGLGNRPLFIAVPQFPTGVDVGLGIINDETGIVEFFFGRYSKKRMKEFREIFFQQVGEMMQTSVPHAGTLLEKAYAQNEDLPSAGAEGYLQLRSWLLDNVALLDRSPIYDLLSREDIAGEMFTASRARKLLDHEFLLSWMIEPEDLKSLVEEIIKAEESPLFISEDQKSNRIREIKEKGIRELYPESKRLVMKGRLEETAYLLFKKGEEEYARLALAAALSLAEADTAFSVNPFLEVFVERNLDLLLDGTDGASRPAESAKEPSPQIIIP